MTDADDITDADDTDSLTFDITVGANQPPTAVVGDDRTVAEGDNVTLDGSGSADPEEQPLTYAWTASSGITLSDDTAAMPTFTAPEVDGTNDYTFTLIVNDGVQDSAAASVTITVEDDTAPSFGADVDDQAEVEHIAMEALELPAATAGNGTLTYALACASGQTGCEGTPALPPGLSFDASTRTLSGTPTATGTTTLTYTVTDADDNTADTDTGTLSFDITVNANQAPTAHAGDDRTVAEGDTVTLDGSGSARSGGASRSPTRGRLRQGITLLDDDGSACPPSTRPRSTARPTTPSPSSSTTGCRTPPRRVSPSRWRTTAHRRSGRKWTTRPRWRTSPWRLSCCLKRRAATGRSPTHSLVSRGRPDAPALPRCLPASASMRRPAPSAGRPTRYRDRRRWTYTVDRRR